MSWFLTYMMSVNILLYIHAPVYSDSHMCQLHFPLQDYENFEAYICKAYSGESPNACSGLTVITNQVKESNGHACYAGEMIRPSTVVENDEMKIKMVI